MYLLYTDLTGVLVDYSLSSRSHKVDAGLSCEDVREPGSAHPRSASSRLASLLGNVASRRSRSSSRNGAEVMPRADSLGGNHS